MEFQQLRYLVAVAETENFTRASERCHVAQPSLSAQIIKLEKELGHKLFHRLGRRAVPTEAGLVFLERARRILRELEDATREMRDSDQIDRQITVGAIPTIAPNLIPPLLALAKARHPQLEISIREDFGDDLTEGVLDGHLDLAILATPAADARLNWEPLFAEPLVLVLGTHHPLASKPTLQLEDLEQERFVMMGSRSSLADEIRKFCEEESLRPKIAYHCAQIATVKSLVSMGLGISILPQGTITPADRTQLVSKTLRRKHHTRDIGVIRHLNRYQSRGASQFLALLKEHTSGRHTGKA